MYCCCKCICWGVLILGFFELIIILVLVIPLAHVLGAEQVVYKRHIISQPFVIFLLIFFLVDCLARPVLITGVLEENTAKLTFWINFEKLLLILSFMGGILGALLLWDILEDIQYAFGMLVRVLILRFVIIERDTLLGVKLDELEKPQVQLATVP